MRHRRLRRHVKGLVVISILFGVLVGFILGENLGPRLTECKVVYDLHYHNYASPPSVLNRRDY